MQPLVNLGLQKITETVGIDFNAKENQKKLITVLYLYCRYCIVDNTYSNINV